MQNKRQLVILLVVSLVAALLWTFSVQASVTLSDFRAQGGSSHITIFWETATELDNFGFHIWRGQTNSLDNANRITTNIIPSQVGGQPIGAEYEYEDNTTQPGIIYFYWLEAIDVNSLSVFYGPEQAVMTSSNPLGTATPGSNNASPSPTSTSAATHTPPPANTAAPSPTLRPQASPTSSPPTPTRQPANTPLPTANVAGPAPTQIPATAAAETGLPTSAPPIASEPPATQAAPPAAQPQPTAAAISAVSGTAAGEATDSNVQVVGANTIIETPSTEPGGTPAPTANSLSPVALLGLAAGILLSIGGIITVVALVKRRQTSQYK